MSIVRPIFDNLIGFYSSEELPAKVILAVILAVALLSAYEFAVYRLVSHRAFYDRSYNITLAALPFFIASIVLCLQSNLVITLGTIGALAIIRFRTAVKDPVDMVYLLWSIHTGIVCGCRLFEVGVLISLAVTIVLLIMEHLSLGGHPQILVVHTDRIDEETLTAAVRETAKRCRVKSRCSSKQGFDYVFELTVKDPAKLMEKLDGISGVKRFSLIEYDSQDIL